MTPAEQQLRERLQSFAGGLTVTGTDVDRAEERLRERLADRSRRSRRRVVLAAAVAAAVAVAGVVLILDRLPGPAPTPPTPVDRDVTPPTVDQVIGVWAWFGPNGRVFLHRHGADGTYAMPNGDQRNLTMFSTGTYELEANRITYTNATSPVCEQGESWTFEVGVVQNGQLSFAYPEPGFNSCMPSDPAEWTMVRVSPRSPGGAELTAGPPGEQSDPVIHRGQLLGIWLLEGSGQLLYVNVDGSYALDDDGELGAADDDVGTVEVTEGTVVFTSGSESADCADGDSMIWEGLQWDVATLALRGVTVSRDTCSSRGDLSGTWMPLWG